MMSRRGFGRGLALDATASFAVLLPGASQALTPRRGGTLTMIIQPEPPVLVTLAHTAMIADVWINA
ncbi:hypothetical protein MKL09_19610 [Methylobacterium sp. J-048]|uniref:hypothetical protein n=1 Tax=Methylobacterium sp. J-048 TaxID=2836635 RepID=UPI001FBA1F63|nr:hypothetical protein [Methylobacterium sp. J-048]MCJ2058744.1 hypothetical protein [Methylobacterium sp. J-048]